MIMYKVNLIPCSILLLIIMSCGSVDILNSGGDRNNPEDKIRAENRILKQNFSLSERENDILRNENMQYTEENSRLKAQVRALESGKEALEKKYDKDMALWNNKYDEFSRRYIMLEKESSARIKELEELNRKNEERLNGEIASLNQTMQSREKKYNSDIEKLEIRISENEALYKKELSVLNRQLNEYRESLGLLKIGLDKAENEKKEQLEAVLKKEKEISKLNIYIKDLLKQIEDSVSQIDRYQKNIDEIKSENARLKDSVKSAQEVRNSN